MIIENSVVISMNMLRDFYIRKIEYDKNSFEDEVADKSLKHFSFYELFCPKWFPEDSQIVIFVALELSYKTDIHMC